MYRVHNFRQATFCAEREAGRTLLAGRLPYFPWRNFFRCEVRHTEFGALKHNGGKIDIHLGISTANRSGVCFLAERGVVFTTGQRRVRWSGIGCRGANRATGTPAVDRCCGDEGDEGGRTGPESYAADRIIQCATARALDGTGDRSYFRASFDSSYGRTYAA